MSGKYPENCRFRRIEASERQAKIFADLWGLYVEALPASERKTRDALASMLGDDRYRCHVAVCDDALCAFAIVYQAPDACFALLEYMATARPLRGRGLGGRLLDAIADEMSDIPMLIEIDSPFQASEDQENRRRRFDFYQRHGARFIDGFHYILPLNAQGTPPDMVLLLKDSVARKAIPAQELKAMVVHLYKNIYGVNEDDPRISRMFESYPTEFIFR